MRGSGCGGGGGGGYGGGIALLVDGGNAACHRIFEFPTRSCNRSRRSSSSSKSASMSFAALAWSII